MDLELVIKEFEEDENVITGICDMEKLYNVEEILKSRETPFVTDDVQKRINPKIIMENGVSIIVIGVGYDKENKFVLDGEVRGNISVNAVGEDYHTIVEEKLKKLVSILSQYKNFEYKMFVDKGDLLERELAKKAGLGYYGKSCNIISKKFGTFFNIGYVITALNLKISNELSMDCGNCEICIKACPSKALSKYKCNYKKCISYLTQKKGELTPEEMKFINLQIYGCDICQRVCPNNIHKTVGEIHDINLIKPKIEDILEMTNEVFKQKYKYTAAGWRGKKTLQRNALIARKNYYSNN